MAREGRAVNKLECFCGVLSGNVTGRGTLAVRIVKKNLCHIAVTEVASFYLFFLAEVVLVVPFVFHVENGDIASLLWELKPSLPPEASR